jgi:hypothetical protein
MGTVPATVVPVSCLPSGMGLSVIVVILLEAMPLEKFAALAAPALLAVAVNNCSN